MIRPVVLSLLIVDLVPYCVAFRHVESSEEGAFSLWPWPWETVEKCAVAAGSWSEVGEVWVVDSTGRSKKMSRSEVAGTPPCSEPGFAVHTHGDHVNQVSMKDNGRFLYVAGSEPGTGAGATVCDVHSDNNGLEYVYTKGLTGCMALSMTGTHRSSGTRDMFFAHLRRWSDYRNAVLIPTSDPLYDAQEFVRNHYDLNIFYGSGGHVYMRDGHYDPLMEARILSGILGVWVMNDGYHSIPMQRDLAFDILLEAWVPLSSGEQIVRTFSHDEKEVASLFKTPDWKPNHDLINALATMEQVKDSDRLEYCVAALRAYSAGDYATMWSLSKNPPVDYGQKLKSLIDRSYNDMVEKGYENRNHQKLQIQNNRTGGRRKISTPREPAT